MWFTYIVIHLIFSYWRKIDGGHLIDGFDCTWLLIQHNYIYLIISYVVGQNEIQVEINFLFSPSPNFNLDFLQYSHHTHKQEFIYSNTFQICE